MSATKATLQQLASAPTRARAMIGACDEGAFPHVLALEDEWTILQRALAASGQDAVVQLALGSAGWTPMGGDVGAFGPARVLDTRHVAEVATVVEALSLDAACASYPSWGKHLAASGDSTWLRQRVEDERQAELESMKEMVEDLIRFYRAAAAAGLAVVAVAA